jgi:hypothetical protein
MSIGKRWQRKGGKQPATTVEVRLRPSTKLVRRRLLWYSPLAVHLEPARQVFETKISKEGRHPGLVAPTIGPPRIAQPGFPPA